MDRIEKAFSDVMRAVEILKAEIDLKKRMDNISEVAKNEIGSSRVLSSVEACRAAMITPPTLRRYRDDGIIETKRVGSRVFYKEEDIMRLAALVHPRRVQ